jgi:D-alanine-D-alanine ligase
MSERVVVIAGGLGPERDVSIRSGRRVAEELRVAGFQTEVRDLDSTLLSDLLTDPPDCAFPLVHGVAGEDGSLQEVLQAIDIPFVGSDSCACRRSFDKSIAGSLVENAGIGFPTSVALPQAMFRDLGAHALLQAITAKISFPLVIKPNRGGSALGVSVVRDAAFAYGEVVLIQQYIEGTEVAVGVYDSGDGVVALPATEIVPDSGLYDYTARYTAGTTEFFTPARLDERGLEAAAETAITAHRVLGLRDWSRSDLVVDREGRVWFLEVNVAPGMTETSLYPQEVAAADESMAELLKGLVKRAIAGRGRPTPNL